MEFIANLHSHVDYSNARLRDCINSVEKLIDTAVKLGHTAVAITDHDCVGAALKAENYRKKYPDFKVILGNEIYLCRDGLAPDNFITGQDQFFHFILLSKDAEGHKQIRELSTRAWLRSFTYKKLVRVPTYYSDVEEIIGANPGHVIGTTACLGGFLPKKLLEYNKSKDPDLYQKILNWCGAISDIFGPDNFYLELQPSATKEQKAANLLLIQLSKETGLPYIFTTDAHYPTKDKAPIHEAFLKAEEGDREVADFYLTTYMMNTQELESYMPYFDRETFDEGYRNIQKIADSCEMFSLKKPLRISEKKWKTPKSTIESQKSFVDRIPALETFIESDYHGDNILAGLVVDRIIENPEEFDNPETFAAIQETLDMTWQSSVVNKAHWSAYFLNLQKDIDLIWEAGSLVGSGRGSGVGFILLYMLGITQINPLRETTKTYSWRFLNPERVSVLDVDIDIESERREDVLNKLREEYGADRVANVVTWGTEKSKSAILTAARGLGIDIDTASYIASLIPADRGIIRSLHECYYGDEEKDMKPVRPFVEEMNNYPELWQVASEIEGLRKLALSNTFSQFIIEGCA